MVDPTTANTSMSVPIRGSDVGTWDTPVNGNFNILDSMFGSVATIALTSAPVTLTTSQAQCNVIRLTGTLNSNVAITMASIYKFWTIDNQVVNSPSSFCATLVSTSGASIIGCPPGTTDIFYDGTTMTYTNLGRIGEYWDYAGTTVPTWVTNSTKPPWLNCTGTTFSSATYPILANLLGGTTLPDSRNRARVPLSQGSVRLNSSVSNMDGTTLFAAGGGEAMMSHTHAVTDVGHIHAFTYTNVNTNAGGGTGASLTTSIQTSGGTTGTVATTSAVTGIGIQTAGTGTTQNVQPTYVGGITMIRAA